ncbi:hypothetical protein QQS21_011990 [Conoideocrella luteorostrata]|uniref:Uncharacterized protein n=1 Tax=Conoideocrella luteorostrata TaxID=1105319 RepID=A0AAJ0CED0_9HYPO|nr:hypothetical protein QQS21_011990 [Conoideocrella luteorostrata]
MTDPGPPSYMEAISHSVNARLSGTEQYTLVLDGCNIYPATPPSQFLYEISSPPCDALNKVYNVQKWRYRLSDHEGDGTIKSRLDHIYDFKDMKDINDMYHHSVNTLRPAVMLEGQTCNKRGFREIVLLGGHTGWSTCAATEGWFKAEISMRDRFKKDGQISWRSRDGILVAVETRATRRPDGSVDRMPRLEIRGVMLEKDLDLLVSCWVARVWKEAQDELKEPMRWQGSKFHIVSDRSDSLSSRLLTYLGYSQEDCESQEEIQQSSIPGRRWCCDCSMLSGMRVACMSSPSKQDGTTIDSRLFNTFLINTDDYFPFVLLLPALAATVLFYTRSLESRIVARWR